MKWSDILREALSNLLRRKLRAFLTMLGVVIGTAAIVVTISLGYGAERTQLDQLSRTTNLRILSVSPQYTYFGLYGMEGGGGRSVTEINDRVIADIRRMEGVEAVTPIVYGWFDMTNSTGKYENTSGSLTAVYPADFRKMYELKSGHGFTGNLNQMEFIMNEYNLMNFIDPKGREQRVDVWGYMQNGLPLPLPDINWFNVPFKVTMRWLPDNAYELSDDPKPNTKDFRASMVGILPAKFYTYAFDYDTLVDLNWARKTARENKELFGLAFPNDALTKFTDVRVLAKSIDVVSDVKKKLDEYGLNTYSELQWLESFREQIRTMQGFLSFIGAVSMLVAALSIANTMMMSIYERTREIGVMKVLGCKLGNIRLLFLAEAGYIGLFGGGLGLLASYGVSYALNNVEWLQRLVENIMSSNFFYGSESTASLIPAGLAWGTWAFVVGVALCSGLYPAYRAMRLSSLAAIRNSD